MESVAKHNTKTILSKTDNLSHVRKFIEAEARSFGFSDEDISNIVLAVDEACTNIIKHAYRYASDKEIEISVFRNKHTFEIRIKDSGKPFDPSAVLPLDLKKYIGNRQRGGLGVYLMRRLMDKVEYSFVPGKKNEVCLVKYLQDPSTAQGRQ
jgi:serine/threonine-protein kinase RsbW